MDSDLDTGTLDESIIDEVRRFLPDDTSREELLQEIQKIQTAFSSIKSCGKEHAVGAPIIEIHDVTICSHHDSIVDDQEEPFEIYGVIQVSNGQDETFDLYNQPEHDPDPISFGEKLYLMDGEPILAPFPVTKIYIHLMDNTKGIELADGILVWDYTEKKISLQEEGKKSLKCENSIIVVRYTTYEAAVVAHIDVMLCKKNDAADDSGSGCHDIDIVGDISASYKCNYSFTNDFSTSLVSVGKENPLRVELGTSIPLVKSIMAVPIYSSFKIQVSLWDLLNDHTIHTVMEGGSDTRKMEGPNGYLVNVRIKWRPGNPFKKMEWKACRELIVDDDSPLAFWIYKESTKRNFRPSTFIEVYSIVIFPEEKENRNATLLLYGEVAIDTVGDDDFYLFKRDKGCPESFPCGQGSMLMTEGPHRLCFQGTFPYLGVKLKDVGGHVFCKGYFSWNETTLSYGPYNTSWYDRRLCSIIQGDYGLVKVHYSIFSKAVKATVIVFFSFDDCWRKFATNVNGSIFAGYGNYEYTPYDKDYYRSILFLKSEASPLKLIRGRKIPLPLLKSVISVPTGSSLTIEVDLDTRVDGEALKGFATFEFGIESWCRLRNKAFFIDVLGDWG